MFNDETIRNVLIVIGGLVLMFVGIQVMAASRRAEFSEVARTAVTSLVGVVIMAAGAGALLLVAFGQKVIETIFPSDAVAEPTPVETARLITHAVVDVISTIPLT